MKLQRARIPSLAVCTAALLLGGVTGCSDPDAEVTVAPTGAEGDGTSEDEGGEPDADDGGDGEDVAGQDGDDEGGEGGEDDDGSGGDESPGTAWPDPIPVDAVGRHPDGVVVELFEVRAQASSVDIDVRITNGQGTPARLSDSGTPATLTDDTGTTYPLVPPEGDRQLFVGDGDVVEGTLSFSGPLSPDATTLRIEFNPDRVDEDRQGSPYLLVEEFPIDGADEASTADDEQDEG
jgi:hypothetical protein